MLSGPVVFEYEEAISLPMLYHARDFREKPAIPDDIVVVTPYEFSDFNDPGKLRFWDRRHHAAVMERLVELGARVIVVDIQFPLAKPEEDKVLVAAMMKSKGLVLIQNAQSRSLNRAGDKAYSLRNPVRPYPENASLMASPAVSAESAEVNRVPLFNVIWHDSLQHECYAYPARVEDDGRDSAKQSVMAVSLAPTLAFTVLEQHLLLAMQASDRHRQWAQAHLRESLMSRPACDLMNSLRSAYRQGRMTGFPDFVEPDSQQYLMRWREVLSEQKRIRENDASGLATLHLNYFGPPGSIETLTYAEVMNMRQAVAGNRVTDRTVFLGGSFKEVDDQKEDGYRTVYTDGGRMMSGVEINATAFANLKSGMGLHFVSRWGSFLMLFGSTCILWFAASRLSVVWFALFAVLEVTVVVFVASWLFTVFHLLLPLATTLTLLALMMMLAVVWRFRLSSLERDRAINHLNAFVSDAVVRQLDTDHNHEVEKAVCLVTDIRNFTQMGKTMAPGNLHLMNDAYFTHLFDCVSSEGVDVVKTYGDSLTAVWMSGSEEAVDRAVRAGLKILATTGRGFHANTPGLETHIGMHRGDLAIGFVGSDKRRTVEITGGTVYLASRLEQLNKVLKTRFLVTADVKVLLRNQQVRSRGLHELKGFDSAVEVFEIGLRQNAVSNNVSSEPKRAVDMY